MLAGIKKKSEPLVEGRGFVARCVLMAWMRLMFIFRLDEVNVLYANVGLQAWPHIESFFWTRHGWGGL